MSNLKNRLKKTAEFETDEEYIAFAEQTFTKATECKSSIESAKQKLEALKKDVSEVNPRVSEYMQSYVIGNLQRALDEFETVLKDIEKEFK